MNVKSKKQDIALKICSFLKIWIIQSAFASLKPIYIDFTFTGRDPVVIERSNLVNISKLVVKELIEQSLRYGRMLDSDHMPLQHFFIVLEHVLRHGLRPKKVTAAVLQELTGILMVHRRDCLVPRKSCGTSCRWSKSMHPKPKTSRRAFAICQQCGRLIHIL